MKTIGFIISFFIFLVIQGNACSCSKVKIKDGFKGANLIFTGKVIKVDKIETIDTLGIVQDGKVYTEDYIRFKFTFLISELIKGNLKEKEVTITTTGGGADCGNYFEFGSSHLVYAYLTDRKVNFNLSKQKVAPFFTTSLCTRTKDLKVTLPIEILRLKNLAKRNNNH